MALLARIVLAACLVLVLVLLVLLLGGCARAMVIDVGAVTRVHCFMMAYRGPFVEDGHSQGEPLARCVELLRDVIRTWEHRDEGAGNR